MLRAIGALKIKMWYRVLRGTWQTQIINTKEMGWEDQIYREPERYVDRDKERKRETQREKRGGKREKEGNRERERERERQRDRERERRDGQRKEIEK